MAVAKTPIIDALVARVKTVVGVDPLHVYTKDFEGDDIPPEMQPAIVVSIGEAVPEERRGLPPKWSLHFTLIVYVVQMVDEVDPDQRLVNLLDAIETALERKPTESITDPSNPFQTNLGGKCSRCWISGPAKFFSGQTTQQGAMTIPVEILVNP